MASGGDNISAIDTDPVDSAYVLYGAVVGGRESGGMDEKGGRTLTFIATVRANAPADKGERFFDIRSDWPQTEVSFVALIGRSDASTALV
jgi:endoglucanase